MNEHQKFSLIGRKTRQRLFFALVTMMLYFCFVLNYTSWGGDIISALSVGSIPGPLVMFAALILIFIGMELLFLFLNRNDASK